MMQTDEDRKKKVEEFIRKLKEEISPYSAQVFDKFRQSTVLEKEEKEEEEN